MNNKYLDKELVEKLAKGGKDLAAKIGEDVFYGRIVNDIFCNLILQKIREYELQENKLAHQANSMHNSSILLADLGLKELVNEFFKKTLVKVIHSLLPECMNQEFDNLHGYVVRYGDMFDKNLAFHVDDSLITINLCLNEDFSGSELVFQGVRCPTHINTDSVDEEEIVITHKKGFAVIHYGKNRHYVNPIADGKRYGLIIWCQNSTESSNWHNALRNHQCMDSCNHKKYLQ